MDRLAGKTAVVTGAGSGIGRATALAFVREGARVFAVDRDERAAEQTARDAGEPADKRGEMVSLAADVSRAVDVKALFERVAAEAGRLEILFNGVGISGRAFGDGPVDECTEDGWDHVLDVNLKSAYRCCHHAIPLLSAGGAIINVASVLGMKGGGHWFSTHAYAASKGGVIALSRAMATYYAPRGIRVNVIAPGLIDTPMSRRAQADPDLMAHVARIQPLRVIDGDDRGLGRPEDVAAAAVYLAAEESAFVTGIVLPVDGGCMAL